MAPEILAKIDFGTKVRVRIVDDPEYGGNGSVVFDGWSKVDKRLEVGVLIENNGLFADWDEILDAKFQIEHIPGHELIESERDRQIHEEGYKWDHDDAHIDCSLIQAAITYATPPERRKMVGPIPFNWPWEDRFWKPTPNDRVRELVKAGALIAAEIDRVQRLENKEYNEQQVD